MTDDLNERYRSVLFAIIKSYISSGEPIGSRAVVKNYNFGLSSATIRNIMADLEDYGFLQHPHTSAGRVPTDYGFRLYVNKLHDSYKVSKVEIKKFVKRFSCDSQNEAVPNLMKEASRMLSSLSHCISFVSAPKLKDIILKHINFIELNNNQVLIVFVSQSGIIQNKIVIVEEPVSQRALTRMSTFINHKFYGLSLEAIRKKIFELMEEEKNLYDQLLKKIFELSRQLLEEDKETQIYIEGKENLFSQPEFVVDIKKMKKIFAAFEKKSKICALLDKCIQEEGLHVIIGQENELEEMQDCSMIISTYKNDSNSLGTVGIIGPKRMAYSKLLTIVDCTAKVLTERIIMTSSF
ncbi:MAG: heat-inducible transcriptional repressor HrcA [bacterium]